jgi:hypothetical protein
LSAPLPNQIQNPAEQHVSEPSGVDAVCSLGAFQFVGGEAVRELATEDSSGRSLEAVSPLLCLSLEASL